MAENIPLDALLRRASCGAERMFAEMGEVEMFYLCDAPGREPFMVVTPIVARSALEAHEHKNRVADKMRELFREQRVTRYAWAAECWTVNENCDEQRYATLGYSLANHPARREVVSLLAEDGRELLAAHREIVRPQSGKPYLAKLSPIERPERPEGKLLNLLPATPTSADRHGAN